MKILLLTLMLVLSVSAFGQTPPTVTVSGQNWSVKREVSRTQTITSSTPDQEDWVQHARISQANASRGLPAPPPPSPRIATRTAVGPEKSVYYYEVTVKNSGVKTISAVTWEYVFSTPDNKRELGRLAFTTKKVIRPGQEKKLTVRTTVPPTASISADSLSKDKNGSQYADAVVIKKVEYTDGTFEQ